MWAKQGIVTLLNEPEHGARIGPDWLSMIAHLSPAPNHLLLRAGITSSSTNHIDISTLQEVFELCKQHDFEIVPVLHNGIEQYYGSLNAADLSDNSPNAKLGLNGNPLLNNYINHYSITSMRVLQQLPSVNKVFLGNEPNLLVNKNLKAGEYCPPNIPGKESAVSPEVFGSTLYTTAMMIKKNVPTIEHIWPSAFSLLVKFHTDPKGPWILGYWEKALQYLKSHGIVSPYPWEGIALNMEGLLDNDSAQYIATSLKDFMNKWGITGPLVVGEWGVPAANLDINGMNITYKALRDHFDYMFFFQSSVYDNYGVANRSINPQGFIIPTTTTAWYDVLPQFYTG